MFDLNNIKGRIVAKGLTAKELAPMLNIGVCAMCDKLNGKSEFKRSEIARLLEILEIDIAEIGNYFF